MGPPEVPRVPISGPHCGIFSKLHGPGLLASGGHSQTSFSTGEFYGDNNRDSGHMWSILSPGERRKYIFQDNSLPLSLVIKAKSWYQIKFVLTSLLKVIPIFCGYQLGRILNSHHPLE